MIGETVYHYRILDKIGEGGMGVVYRAEDINLRRTVALKFLSPSSDISGSTRERIMKEARAAASLDHQNICAIHEVEELDDKLFIVMAYCKGRTLGNLIKDNRPDLKASLNILIQIAEGLGAAHEAGIIHRDIKPANVIVSDRGKVKIMDFGLAKQSGAETRSMTMAGAGTLAYMSPEQVRGDHVDPRSDIWSLGVLMYQMLTGRRPFEGDYDASVLYSIVNDPHVPVLELDPDIPADISTVIERALRKSPDERYGSMEELHDDLVNIRNLLFGEPETAMTAKAFLKGRKHIFGWNITSILALSVSALLIFVIIRFIIGDGDDAPPKSPSAKSIPGKGPLEPEEDSQAQAFYSRGYDLYCSGDQTTGIALIEQALELDPDHYDALKTLAVCYDWGGEHEKAAGYIQRAKDIAYNRGNNADLETCNIYQAKILHNWDLALRMFGDYLLNNPNAAITHIEMGYILSRYKGDNKGALEHYDLFFKKDPGNSSGRHASAHNYTGTACLYLGDFDQAIEAFTKYRDMCPDAGDPVSSLAGAYLFAGQYKEAHSLYSSLLRLGDPAYTCHEGLGKTCAETGRLRESNEHFHNYLGSVIFSGHKINGRLRIALNYLVQKDGDSFDRELAKIDEIDPEASEACWLRGMRFISLELDIDRARAQLNRLTELMERPFVFEETSHHEHLWGLILLAEGRTLGAFEALERAERKSPREFFYFGKEYARVLLEAGRTDEAIEECDRLSQFNPNNPELLMILCRAKVRKGDMDSAKEYYDRTLEVLAEADEDYVPLLDFKKELEKLDTIGS